jgi:alanine racemase
VKPVRRAEFLDEAGFAVREEMRIGVIPMGLADGLAQLTSGEVLVRGRRSPVIGIFFEHARLDLTDLPEASAGDEVVVIGRQGGDEITLDEVAERLPFPSLSPASLVRESVPKVYIGRTAGLAAEPQV